MRARGARARPLGSGGALGAALILVLGLSGPLRAQYVEPTCTARGVRIMAVPFTEVRGADGRDDKPLDPRLVHVGRNVGAVLALQVLLTLRAGKALGSGVSVWEPRIVRSVTSHHEAERAARERANPPQLVLWGTVLDYGEWVVVQPRLTVVPDTEVASPGGRLCNRTQVEVWRAGSRRVIAAGLGPTVGLPRLSYAFEPLTLGADVVARYGEPSGLRMYRRRSKGGRLSGDMGPMGDRVRALLQTSRSLQVLAGGRTGWIDISGLGAQSEAVDFVGGLARLMRGDFRRAEAPLARVARSANSPADLRVHALLLQALARAHRGRPRGDLLHAAEQFAPHDVELARARIAQAFARLGSKVTPRDGPGGPTIDLPPGLRQLIRSRRYLFAPDDRLWRELALSGGGLP